MMGGSIPKITYRVYDKETKELLAEGSARECAEALGIKTNTFRNRCERALMGGANRCWDVEVENQTLRLRRDQEAIRAWDEFMAPLRRKYGIKVKRGWEKK